MKRFAIPAVISFVLLATLVFQASGAHFIDGQSDFRAFYAAGYILRTGQSFKLYDYEFQHDIQDRIVGGDLTLPFIHMPHEAALFVPLSLLPYKPAYILYGLLNLGLLALCYRLLRPMIVPSVYGWLPFALFAAFLPIAATILEGQDSILFLTLLTLASVSLERNNDLLAGCFVGLCLFKFQLAVPIALLFLIWKKWKFAVGFVVTALFSLLASLATIGLDGMKQYVRTLVAISLHLNSQSQRTKFGVYPAAMANVRGLVHGLLQNHLPATSLFIIVAGLSLAVVALAARSSHQAMSVAITAAILVSYHSMNHDLTIMLIPIAAALNSADRGLLLSGLLVFAAPLVFIFALPYLYLTCIPLLALLITSLQTHSNGALGRAQSCPPR